MTLYKFIFEQNVREIQYIEVIAYDEETAWDMWFAGKGRTIRTKLIDSEGAEIIKQTEIEVNDEN